ncbi:MAG: cytochrome c1 [Pseudomonadota bacterium]|nr:cytochrome c1 [Pseudomonadota bacterium]
MIARGTWLAFGLSLIACNFSALHGAVAAGIDTPLPRQTWSFSGVFGSFDNSSVQRGLQVYLEVCANCHGLQYVAYRNLSEVGYGEEEIKSIAAQYEVEDGPDSEGVMFTRPGRPSDYFANPYANEKEAAYMNNGAMPPDLSLIYKARPGGADYIYAILTGYEENGQHEVPEGLYYNEFFPGKAIAMPQPLYGDDVEYQDGTESSIEQQAKDITSFLVWAAEPNLNARKKMGLKVILFLIALTALLYASKRKIWGDIAH